MTNPMPPSATAAVETIGPVRVNLFGRTDVGQVREHNEDNFLVADLTRGTRSLLEPDRRFVVGQRGAVLGVCDGMGGAAAGEVASQLAVDIIYEHMANGDVPQSRDDFARRLVSSVEAAGLRIFTEAKVDRARRGMGTTATIAGVIENHLFLAQVGDSRGYILRGERLVQVTRDQSLVNQLIEAGQLTEAEAETFEHNNIILQALGTADTVQVDLTYVELRAGDTLIICSDGLSGMVRFEEIREILLTVPEPLDACKVLTERANMAGGHDNITVIVAKFDGEGLAAPFANDDLRYRKYPLGECSLSSRPNATTARELVDPRPLNGPARFVPMPMPEPPPRLSDHGPSRSKLTDTMLGRDMNHAALEAAIASQPSQGSPPPPAPWQPDPNHAWREANRTPRDDTEPLYIPTSNAPAWMVGGIVLAALVLAAMVGYYLLR